MTLRNFGGSLKIDDFGPLLIVSPPLLISSATALRSLEAPRGRLLPYTATKAQITVVLSIELDQIWAHVISNVLTT